jgi:hypothetical protein
MVEIATSLTLIHYRESRQIRQLACQLRCCADHTVKSSVWKGIEMATRFSKTMTDDQLRVALGLATIEEIEAALSSGDLTQERIEKLATPTRRHNDSQDKLSTLETGKLSVDDTTVPHEHRLTNERRTDVLKQLKANMRG